MFLHKKPSFFLVPNFLCNMPQFILNIANNIYNISFCQ